METLTNAGRGSDRAGFHMLNVTMEFRVTGWGAETESISCSSTRTHAGPFKWNEQGKGLPYWKTQMSKDKEKVKRKERPIMEKIKEKDSRRR